jgi:protein-disulfide isomerase
MSTNDPRRAARGTTRRNRRDAARTTRQRAAPDRRPAVASKPTARSSPSIALITTVLAVVAGVGLIAVIAVSQGLGRTNGTDGASGSAGASGLVAPTVHTPADLGDTPAELGNPSAPLQMVITSDFQCPICERFAQQELPKVIADFVRPGLLHITVRDVEFLDRSTTESLDAATAASCAGEQGRYWEYHDWLFANQQGENQGAFSRTRLNAIADKVELDRTAFDACMAASTERAKIQANTNAAVAAGIHATPTFVVNGGQPISGLPQYDSLVAYLRSLLPSGSPAAPSASG